VTTIMPKPDSGQLDLFAPRPLRPAPESPQTPVRPVPASLTDDALIAALPETGRRDCAALAAWEPDLLEFHLTDYDLEHGTPPAQDFRGRVALHVPEYYQGMLLDLCALDEPTREARWRSCGAAWPWRGSCAGGSRSIRGRCRQLSTPAG